MKEANWKNFWDQPVAATTEEANARLLFNSCGCTQGVKLNVEWQIAPLSKKVNIDIIHGSALFAALHWFENFKLCNKHQTFLARDFRLVMKKVLKDNITSRLDGI